MTCMQALSSMMLTALASWVVNGACFMGSGLPWCQKTSTCAVMSSGIRCGIGPKQWERKRRGTGAALVDEIKRA